ncbi:MAG: ABC transporter permease [Actinobacteria bacterium]|nr:ABC transporter permease [Actinomycetota bacterium]
MSTLTTVPRERRLRDALARAPQAWFALIFLTVVILLSLLAPLLPLDPDTTDLDAMSAPPSLEHWFGTDQLGRDYFARVVFGGRISLLVGFLAMIAATAIGALVGLVAGFAHPRIDNLLMRLVDFLSSIPWMILVIVASVFLRPGLVTIIIVIGGFTWMTTARLVRAETLSVKERAYVGYSGYIGERAPRIVGRHILPDALPTILVAATTNISQAMMTEASLSFLGVGIQQPMASWGSLLQTAQGSLQQLPHLALIPGLLIMATVFSFNALGNTLRRYLSRGA